MAGNIHTFLVWQAGFPQCNSPLTGFKASDVIQTNMKGTCDSLHRRKDVRPCRRCSLWFLCREPALWPHNTHITDETHTHTLLMRTLHTVIDYLNHELTWWRRSRCQSWPSTWEQTSSHSSVWWCSSERKWFIMMYFTPDFIDKSINLKVECKLKCGGVALTTIVYI